MQPIYLILQLILLELGTIDTSINQNIIRINNTLAATNADMQRDNDYNVVRQLYDLPANAHIKALSGRERFLDNGDWEHENTPRKDALIALINAGNYTPAQKERYIAFANDITHYNGTPVVRRADDLLRIDQVAQNVGTSHHEPIDISGVEGLENFKRRYGVVNGTESVELLKNFAIDILRQKIPELDQNDIINFEDRESAVYNQALQLFNAVIPNETREQATARKTRARTIMEQEFTSSRSRVNEFAAGLRKLNEISGVRDGYCTEHILGRYNAFETLGYATKAALDTQQITMNLIEKNICVTPRAIFEEQKYNVETLIRSLGDAARGLNRNNDQNLDNGGRSISICNHGSCARALGAVNKVNRNINLVSFTPMQFNAEFQANICDEIGNIPIEQVQQIQNFIDAVPMDDILNGRTEFVNNPRRLDFTIGNN